MSLDSIANDITHRILANLEKAGTLSAFENSLRRDDSEYVVVDGEEGDYGEVKYFDKDNQLIASFINEGGDNTYVEITPLGRMILRPFIIEALDMWVNNGDN